MTKIAIVTDSTCGLPSDLIAEKEIIVIPCQLQIGSQTYREGIDLSAEEMFDVMFSSDETPTTSLPAGDDYTAGFAEVEARGCDQMLGIFVGSSLSGTFNGARLNAEPFGFQKEFVDSGTTSVALGLLVLEAYRLVEEGHSLEGTAQEVRRMAERAELYALLDTLEYIRRGGRIGRVGEMIANVFNIKPILRIAGNSVDVVSRSRSFKRGLSWLRSTAEEATPFTAGAVMHTGAEDEAIEMARYLETLNDSGREIIIAPAGAAVAVHSGPKAVGLGILAN